MSKELKSMKDLFEHLLQDMYFAETKIKSTLPKMAKKASSEDLKKGFEKHLEETLDQEKETDVKLSKLADKICPKDYKEAA